MDQQQIDRSLRSIGKECFVNYFEYFKNLKYSNSDLVTLLKHEKGYTESGCRTRISQSRKIIRNGKTKEALNMVIESSKLDNATILKAKKLLLTHAAKSL
jgi:hypothetical protein